jgi:hypothetical protein
MKSTLEAELTNTWQRRVKAPSRRDVAAKLQRLRTDWGLWSRKRAHRRGRSTGQASAGFVVGCQRSGTDMVLWTLDRAMNVDRFDEDHPVAFADSRLASLRVRARLVRRSKAEIVLFKPVCDSHRVTTLLDEHPQSRAAWIYRDYRDVANSAVERWGDMNRRFIIDLARNKGAWGRRQWNRELVVDDARAAALAELAPRDINAHTASAIFWWLVNETYFDQRLDANERVVLASYEDLVTNPAQEFERLSRFFGAAYDDGMVADISRASLRRESREPIAEPVAEACESLLARLKASLAESKHRFP